MELNRMNKLINREPIKSMINMDMESMRKLIELKHLMRMTILNIKLKRSTMTLKEHLLMHSSKNNMLNVFGKYLLHSM